MLREHWRYFNRFNVWHCKGTSLPGRFKFENDQIEIPILSVMSVECHCYQETNVSAHVYPAWDHTIIHLIDSSWIWPHIKRTRLRTRLVTPLGNLINSNASPQRPYKLKKIWIFADKSLFNVWGRLSAESLRREWEISLDSVNTIIVSILVVPLSERIREPNETKFTSGIVQRCSFIHHESTAAHSCLKTHPLPTASATPISSQLIRKRGEKQGTAASTNF